MESPLTVALTGAMSTSGFVRKDHDCDALVSIVDHLIPSVERRLEIKIRHTAARWSQHHIKGCLRRFAGLARITYNADLNRCNKRFVIAKEIAHLLNDVDGKDHVQTVDDAIGLVDFITNPEAGIVDQMRSIVSSETVAEIYAIELLLPHCHRQSLAGASAVDIAEMYKIPSSKAELYLMREYESLCNEAHATFAASADV